MGGLAQRALFTSELVLLLVLALRLLQVSRAGEVSEQLRSLLGVRQSTDSIRYGADLVDWIGQVFGIVEDYPPSPLDKP